MEKAPDIRTCTWEELDGWVKKFREKVPALEIWEDIDWGPMTAETIGEIAQEWKEGRGPIGPAFYDQLGMVKPGKRVCGFIRDMFLFHNLVHEFHSETLNEFENEEVVFNMDEIQAVSDWIARKARADVKLLRQALAEFELTPMVYDRISLLASPAFFDPEKQLAFPFGEQLRQELTSVRMDFKGILD